MTKQEIAFYDKEQTDGLLAEKADTADLATVAFTGDYDDLTDKPVIPAAQVNSDWNASTGVAEILNKPDLSVYQLLLVSGSNIKTVNGNSLLGSGDLSISGSSNFTSTDVTILEV